MYIIMYLSLCTRKCGCAVFFTAPDTELNARMYQSYKRPKEPDPIIWKEGSSPNGTLSVASTTVSHFSASKASYGDLSCLIEPSSLLLPPGSLEDNDLADEQSSSLEHGDRHGKFVARSLSRELSFDGEGSDIEPERLELFTRLLAEADRVSVKTGCHIKVTKLTTSKTSPYKTLLRHPYD
jgi:hypothetical protein